MNGANELLRAILKVDEEERARTQATEEYRQKAHANRSAVTKQLNEQAMAQMHQNVEAFAKTENERAQHEKTALEQRKTEIIAQLEHQAKENKQTWVDTIASRVIGRGE